MPNFSFALDGKADMMSLNPLEMTNFEMAGAIAGLVGVILTIVLSRRAAAKTQRPHEFPAREMDDSAFD